MTLSASDTPVKVEISESGSQGEPGTDGTDGIGFNNVRKTLLDNPLCWLYKKNNIVNILNQTLLVDRPATGNYTDIYGAAQVAPTDEPREEVEGWLIDNAETHTLKVLNNVPDLNNDFSVVIKVGAYSEAVTQQEVFVVPSTSGDLLSLGTDSGGNWIATIQGSDTVQYEATTVISATAATAKIIILEYVTDTLNIHINNALAGTIVLPTALTAPMDLESVVTLAGNFTLNIQGLRFYDFVLNTDEMTYINE